jgi:FtsP/CotA-like multicopper oxidase with cupredoxin domain
MRPGEVQRWRILHAGWQDDMFIELAGHVLHSIARDGIPLSRPGLDIPRKPDQSTDHQNALLMAPGQRVDVLVQAGSPGDYLLRAVPYDQGYAAPTGPIARLVVEGEPTTMKLPARLPPLREKIIRDEEITGTRTLTFATKSPGTDEWRKYRFLIDGRSFDPDRVDHRVRLGAVEEWTIVNEDASDDHVFHIHVNDMLLTRVNGEPLPDPIWLDTAIVPRQGSITFRSRFLDFTGKFALHCHMMNHEDLGMMQIVEVYDGDT